MSYIPIYFGIFFIYLIWYIKKFYISLYRNKHKMTLEIKNRFEERMSEVKKLFRPIDPIYKFLSQDHVGEFTFQSGLRMLPLELVENYGTVLLQDEKEYQKYFKPEYEHLSGRMVQNIFKGIGRISYLYWKNIFFP
jgi:hypothetical protein